MRKLYLHVGVHRTGTTSIQRFMRANFNVLLQKGYLYPFGVARHNAVVGKLRYGLQSFDEFARDLNRRMEARAAHSAIISDEDMSRIVDISQFGALTKVFDVKVVVSLRRQDLWLESWYLQNLKWQWDHSMAHVSLDEFYDRRAEFFWIDYAARLAEYEAVFGQGSVIAGVFEEADMPEGPIAAFLNLLGIQDMTGFGPMLHKNASMSARTTEFLRHLPLDEMPEKDRGVFERAATELDKTIATNGSKLILPHPRRLEVMAEHKAGNDSVADRYFKRQDLFRKPLPPADTPLADMVLPVNSEDLLREFVAPFVRALAARVHEIRQAEAEPAKPDQLKKTRVRART
jgi:hypothetical protein